MIGIIFTTEEEYQLFAEQYAGGRFGELNEGEHVQDGDVLAAVSGIGKIKATLHIERLLTQVELNRLIHVGTCTALSEEVEIGERVAATHVLEGDRIELSAPSYPRMPLETPFEVDTEGTLVTHDHELGGEEERSYWQRIAEISDTTGYAVAFVAAQHGVPCHIVKIPTAYIGRDNETFYEDLQAAQGDLTDFLLEDALEEDEDE